MHVPGHSTGQLTDRRGAAGEMTIKRLASRAFRAATGLAKLWNADHGRLSLTLWDC